MQYPTRLVTPAAPPIPSDLVNVGELANVPQIGEAMDYAARVAKATVGEFVAAPLASDDEALPGSVTGLEVAVEFLVPPCSAAQFADELDRALMRRSPGYSTARRRGALRSLTVTVLPPGAFHQWRQVWRLDPRTQQLQRWSANRATLDAILRQAQVGWREA
jgi:hypothetical protein